MILQKNGRAEGIMVSPCPPVGSANHVVRSPLRSVYSPTYRLKQMLNPQGFSIFFCNFSKHESSNI